MKFLVDAQLPSRLARHLTDAGHDAVHTLDLPERNRTTDHEISKTADAEDRIVVTKDGDFRHAHLLAGTPARLLIVSTGNITNRELLTLFDAHLKAIIAAFEQGHFVELGPDDLTILDDA